MDEPARRYWFPAKRYGWGWGLPITWEGWTFLILWVLALVAGSRYLVARDRALYGVFVVVMVAVILAICYAKGEPPRWNWGDKNDQPPPRT